MPDTTASPETSERSAEDRLESWKEIAAHLNRDVRTVQRWEKSEGLPVRRHQHDKLGSVWAYRSEIEVWWQARQKLSVEAPPAEPELSDSIRISQPVLQRSHRKLWIALVIAVLVAGSILLLRTRIWPQRPSGKVTLGVLPFKNLNGGPDYFSEGLTEEMIARLGRLHPEQLSVVVVGNKSDAKSPDRVSNTSKLDYILEGTVRRADGRVRITAQLVHVKDQTRVWGDSYERDLKDILSIQSDVATSIAGAIIVKLPPTAPTRAVNPEAYEAYLKGRFFWNKRTSESLKKAIDYFNLAIQKDPNYALAYAGKADCYALLGSIPYAALPPREAFPKAKAAAERALQLDDNAPEAHVSLSYIHLVYDWDLTASENEIKRALELAPGNATAHQYYGYVLNAAGDLPQALAERKKAEELDPTSPVIAAAVGEAYYQSRRYDLSIEQNQKSLELDPTFAVGLVNQGRALTQQGKHEQAQRDFQLALAASPNDAALLACLGYEYAVSDNNAGAREIIGRLQKLQAQGYVPAVYFAAIYTGLGDKDEAFRWLNRALNERCEYLVYIQNDPMSEPLLKDPRFTELLRKIGIVKTVAFSIPTQWFRAA